MNASKPETDWREFGPGWLVSGPFVHEVLGHRYISVKDTFGKYLMTVEEGNEFTLTYPDGVDRWSIDSILAAASFHAGGA